MPRFSLLTEWSDGSRKDTGCIVVAKSADSALVIASRMGIEPKGKRGYRQMLAVEVKDAGELNPPIKLGDGYSTRTIDEIFEATRAAITEPVGEGWSPAHHVRRVA